MASPFFVCPRKSLEEKTLRFLIRFDKIKGHRVSIQNVWCGSEKEIEEAGQITYVQTSNWRS